MQIIHSVQTKQTTKYAKISYLLFFIFAFWGPALGGVPLGAVSLFPARIFAFQAAGLPGSGQEFPAQILASDFSGGMACLGSFFPDLDC